MSNSVIAIDGPCASGKSSVSRRVAQRLRFVHVDSGALYRGLTWYFLRAGIKPANAAALAAALKKIRMDFFIKDSAVEFSLGRANPGAGLRSSAVNAQVSEFAALPPVRAWIVRQLRRMPAFGSLVMEGRDIGTAVFPEAKFKFYLDATPAERARRRQQELEKAGVKTDYAEVLRSIRKRDGIDSARACDPLKIAPDAVVIQTTSMGIDDVVETIVIKVLPPALPGPRSARRKIR